MMRTLLLLLTLATTAPAAAQSALKGHNTDAPINVDAKSIDVLDAKGQAVFSGDVRVTQGDMKLNADSIRVSYSRAKGGGDPQINRLDANNNVKLVTPSETATGRLGIYDVGRKTITLVGGVTLAHGDSVLHGERLAIDLDSGRSRLDGASTGPAAPGATTTGNGRVRGTFVVPPRNGNK